MELKKESVDLGTAVLTEVVLLNEALDTLSEGSRDILAKPETLAMVGNISKLLAEADNSDQGIALSLFLLYQARIARYIADAPIESTNTVAAILREMEKIDGNS